MSWEIESKDKFMISFNSDELKVIKNSLDFTLCEYLEDDFDKNISISNKIGEYFFLEEKKKSSKKSLETDDIERITEGLL